MTRNVTFKHLMTVLDDLGFEITRIDSFVADNVEYKNVIAFSKKEQDAIILMPCYEDDDYVRAMDLGVTETTLYYKGIAERAEFDALLRRASQPKPARHKARSPRAGTPAHKAKTKRMDQADTDSAVAV